MAYRSTLLEPIIRRRARTNKPISNKTIFRNSGHKKKGKENISSTTFASSLFTQSKKKEKGKHASSTENRRITWEQVVWPLVLEKNRQFFTLREYRIKSSEFSRANSIQPSSRFSGGLISLMNKGILKRGKGLYSIHYKLVPYLRKKANLEYGTAVRGTYTN